MSYMMRSWQTCLLVGLAACLAGAAGDLLAELGPATSTARVDVDVEGQDQTSLSAAMWDSASDLLAQVWETRFIKGVKEGTLDPNFYGSYSMQDAIWCKNVSTVFEQVAKHPSAPQALRDYANHSAGSYLEVAQELWKTFTVREDASIIGADAAKYADLIISSVTNYAPTYIMISTYACSKLWDNITTELNATMWHSSNPYLTWVINSMGSSSEHTAFIDKWASEWYDRDRSISLFREAMRGEIALFNMTSSAPVSLSPHATS